MNKVVYQGAAGGFPAECVMQGIRNVLEQSHGIEGVIARIKAMAVFYQLDQTEWHDERPVWFVFLHHLESDTSAVVASPHSNPAGVAGIALTEGGITGELNRRD